MGATGIGIGGTKGIAIAGGAIACLLVIGLVAIAANQSQFGGSASSSAVATAAMEFASRLSGLNANVYNPTDPLLQPAIRYWEKYCGNGVPLCGGDAASGSLQCVIFVTGTFAIAGDPLPVSAGAAQDFWPLYQGRAGWKEIPDGTGLPMPGDIAVFHHDPFGHVAIVVNVTAPQQGKPGSLTIAQANSPSSLNTMPILSNLSIDTSTWPGYTLLGFIRQVNAVATTPGTGTNGGVVTNMPTSAWVQVAQNDAQANNIPANLFVRQINQESGFNPLAVSPAGAVGIAQFEPSTAIGLGIDPTQPDQALSAAAQLMANYYHQYLTTDPNGGATLAYQKALAAYNAGPATVTAVTNRCGSAWISCLPSETQNYISSIMSS